MTGLARTADPSTKVLVILDSEQHVPTSLLGLQADLQLTSTSVAAYSYDADSCNFFGYPVPFSDLAAFAPYTQFARAAYCPTSKLTNWTCGAACASLPGFQPTLVGGDGNLVQIYFVGYWPAQDSVVVAHQGTDPTMLLSVLTDANIVKGSLDKKLFPGIPSNVQVHSGFRDAHARTAVKVTVVGHSLGGALAQLDALYLSLHLPTTTSVKARTYGAPRVGNEAFANLLDSKVSDLKRIHNKRDVIPIVPWPFLKFMHAQGEVRILSPGTAIACSGQDNDIDLQCQRKAVPIIAAGSILDHLGPYEGIRIGTIFCN
ncbi:putative alpha beta-hydrolase [Lyophyllum shimeji]|uniref:Alpha beta-hydrolase n=1 Tax=Lyophyllum shimeji TaxID=47721 RepID=A0A9P3PLK5_LYOSH|nr:putative alpha beta-hydrolase [Lyophyllum shimeji]